MGKWMDYLTRGPEYRNTWQRSGTQNRPVKAVKCASCGKYASSNDEVCPVCGFDLTSETQLELNQKDARSSRWLVLILVIIGAIVCAAAVYLLLHTPRMA